MPDPPSYTAATKLPTYDEAERTKGEQHLLRSKESSAPDYLTECMSSPEKDFTVNNYISLRRSAAVGVWGHPAIDVSRQTDPGTHRQ